MTLARALRHLTMPQWRARRTFPRATLTRIERAIADSERHHSGQLRFALEHALDAGAILAGKSARDRAIEVFSALRVWDTEQNNGVLIYLLLADRDVEIVADRGIHGRVGTAAWEEICREMEAEFRAGNFGQGVLTGIAQVTRHLHAQFPRQGPGGNEQPDRPAVL